MPSSTQHAPVLVFDIETVVDVVSAQRVYGLEHLEGEALTEALARIRQADLGHSFARLPLHEVVCLSGLWCQQGAEPNLRIFSLSQRKHSEAQVIAKFFQAIDKHAPVLVSYNGKAFDIPVLSYRAMLHGLSCAGLYDQGGKNPKTKYANYQNRYHQKHTDVMDVLARFQPKYAQPLDLLSRFLGLPGKLGDTDEAVDGHAVEGLVAAGKWQTLETYCEHDVVNTWVLYLHLKHLHGTLTTAERDGLLCATRQHLSEQQQHAEFLARWQRL